MKNIKIEELLDPVKWNPVKELKVGGSRKASIVRSRAWNPVKELKAM